MPFKQSEYTKFQTNNRQKKGREGGREGKMVNKEKKLRKNLEVQTSHLFKVQESRVDQRKKSISYTQKIRASLVTQWQRIQCRRLRFNPSVGKIPWKRKWQPTLVFLPGKSYGQRSLAGYSPWGPKRVGHDLATKQQALLEGLFGDCQTAPI